MSIFKDYGFFERMREKFDEIKIEKGGVNLLIERINNEIEIRK